MLDKVGKLVMKEGIGLIGSAIGLFEHEIMMIETKRNLKTRDEDIVRFDNFSLDIEAIQSLITDLENRIESYKKQEGIV